MMLGHTTFERQFQFRDLVPQQPFGHLGQPGSVLFPTEHRFQDRSPRSTQSVGGYRCQLNVGILQHLLNAIRNAVDLLYQTHAIPREVAKFTGWLRGHETPAQQSVLQQIRDPLAVFLVRFPTRHGFNVLRIHQQHLEPLRKNVPHRLPVHPSGLHGHMRYAALREPIGQLKQIVSEGPEALLLFTALPLGLSPQHTCGNTLLMYVQTTTAGIENFHRATPFHRAASDASKSENLLRVLSATSWRLQFVVLPSVPAILVSGLCERQSRSASVANAATQTQRHLEPIFILRCDPAGAMIYSLRNATAGSTRDARCAGITQAIRATSRSMPAVPT